MSSKINEVEPVRVIIVDGDPLICRALARLVKNIQDLEVVATTTDGANALELAGRLQPDIALIDAKTARLDGMELARRMHRQVPATGIIVLSVYASFRDQALAAGACRFLLKDCSRDELVAAIHLTTVRECQR